MNDAHFGHSLALSDGDIVFTNGKLQTVAGRDNLLQALELRVLTPFGSDRFNTTYGLDVSQAFTEPATVRAVKELIKLNLVRTLATDTRVHDVREIIFDDDPLYLERHPEVSADELRRRRRQRVWQVEVILDTVDGNSALLNVKVRV
jgi:hypothetical protein